MLKAKLKFRHIGIACKDIKICRDFIKNILNVEKESQIVFDKNQEVNLCLLTLENGLMIELISGKTVENFVKKGISYYHTCYYVKNISETIETLKNEFDAIVISPPKVSELFEGKLAAFLYSPIGIIELLEE